MPDKQAITEQWLGRLLRTYPSITARFMAQEEDPFRNPVGHAFRQSLRTLVDELFHEMDAGRATQALEFVVQIRAVEDVTPPRALEFIFQLKDILRDEFQGAEFDLLCSRVDEMALIAFDLYVKCRERTYQAKANEARRRLYVLERRLEPCEQTAWRPRGER